MKNDELQMKKSEVLVVQPDLFGLSFMNDPYKVYEELLQYKLARMPMGQSNTWIFSGYDDVLSVLRNPLLSNRRNHLAFRNFSDDEMSQLKRLSEILATWIIYLDGEDHKKLRKFLNKGISTYLSKRTEKVVEEIVGQLIARIKDRDEVDIVTGFSQRLPAMVMISILGSSQADYDLFVNWAENIASFVGTFRPPFEKALAAQQTLLDMDEYFRVLVEEKEKNPQEDLISYMVELNKEEKILSDSELRTLIINLIFAGYETTGHLLTSGIYAFLQFPDQRRKLAENPSLIANATEELLRYESAAQMLGRLALEDVEMHGHTIKKGDLVLALLGAANNDPVRFSNPRVFDIERPFEHKPLSFGAGFHACPGSGLTIIEVKHVFYKLFKELPNLQLAEQVLEWRNINPAFRGFRQLIVKLR